MPAKSQAQRGFLYATKGAAWVSKHHFNNTGKLPAYAKAKKPSKAKARIEMQKIAKGLRV